MGTPGDEFQDLNVDHDRSYMSRKDGKLAMRNRVAPLPVDLRRIDRAPDRQQDDFPAAVGTKVDVPQVELADRALVLSEIKTLKLAGAGEAIDTQLPASATGLFDAPAAREGVTRVS